MLSCNSSIVAVTTGIAARSVAADVRTATIATAIHINIRTRGVRARVVVVR